MPDKLEEFKRIMAEDYEYHFRDDKEDYYEPI
jgi:hypothetical protein